MIPNRPSPDWWFGMSMPRGGPCLLHPHLSSVSLLHLLLKWSFWRNLWEQCVDSPLQEQIKRTGMVETAQLSPEQVQNGYEGLVDKTGLSVL